MKASRNCIWLGAVLALGACSAMGIGDPFSYSQHTDEFDGVRVSEAMAEAVGDEDPTEKVQITLSCEVAKGDVEQGKADGQTALNLLFLDEKGEPAAYSNLQLKFDDEAAADVDWLKGKNNSKNSNEFEIDYLMAGLLMLPEGERGAKEFEITTNVGFAAMYAGYAGMVSRFDKRHKSTTDAAADKLVSAVDKVLNEFAPKIMSAKTLMIRYQSQAGSINTVRLAIDGRNYRKVLTDCGWDASTNEVNSPANNVPAESAGPAADANAPVASGTDSATGAPSGFVLKNIKLNKLRNVSELRVFQILEPYRNSQSVDLSDVKRKIMSLSGVADVRLGIVGNDTLNVEIIEAQQNASGVPSADDRTRRAAAAALREIERSGASGH